jgi:hypothetical protein
LQHDSGPLCFDN